MAPRRLPRTPSPRSRAAPPLTYREVRNFVQQEATSEEREELRRLLAPARRDFSQGVVSRRPMAHAVTQTAAPLARVEERGTQAGSARPVSVQDTESGGILVTGPGISVSVRGPLLRLARSTQSARTTPR